jgi:hypothetical protein
VGRRRRARRLQPPPDDPHRRDDRDGQEHPGDAGNLSARQHPEDDQRGMNLDAAPHDEGHAGVVLDAPPDEDERREKPRMRIAAEEAHPDGEDSGAQRADHGNELEGASDGSEDQGVRHAGRQEDRRPDDERDQGQQHLRSDVLTQEEMKILGQSPPDPSMPPLAQTRDRRGGELLGVLQDEEGQDGDEHDDPGAGEPLQQRRRGLLRIADEPSHVSPGQSLDLGDLAPLPPPALEEAFDDLAALDLRRHFGELLRQALDLRR